MDYVWISCGVVCLLFGFFGCLMPILPGPVLAYAALLLLLPTSHPVGTWALAAGAVAVVVSMALDYLVPAAGARKFGGSAWGVWGCVLGVLVGMFFLPFGLVLGPFLGAFIGELVGGKKARSALKAGFGAFLGFLTGVLLKFCVWVFLACLFVRALCR